MATTLELVYRRMNDGRMGLLLQDQDGDIIPGQRDVTFAQAFREPQMITVSFVVNGSTVSIRPSSPPPGPS